GAACFWSCGSAEQKTLTAEFAEHAEIQERYSASSAFSAVTDFLAFQTLAEVRAQLLHLGQRHRLDVALFRMQLGVVLVVRLGLEEFRQRLEPRHDGRVENRRRVELADIPLGDTLLLVVGVENRGAVLRADVVALAVELR